MKRDDSFDVPHQTTNREDSMKEKKERKRQVAKVECADCTWFVHDIAPKAAWKAARGHARANPSCMRIWMEVTEVTKVTFDKSDNA